jgi:hypothetical protein
VPAPKKPTPKRHCAECRKRLERKRLSNGNLEYLIHFNRRKYCDRVCWATNFDRANPGAGKRSGASYLASPARREKGTCSICDQPVKGLGYCTKHYQRFRKHGDPLAVRSNQYSPLVQSED